MVLTLVRDQISSGNQHNSFFSRLTWFQEALEIWSTKPLTGVGLRWWYTDRFPGGIQPPNALLEVITASGLLGLIGFLALMIGSLLVLWRIPPEYGMLAVLVVLGRFVQGQLDAFWVAAQTSIPFVVAGICLGMHARSTDEAQPAALAGRRGHAPRGAGQRAGIHPPAAPAGVVHDLAADRIPAVTPCTAYGAARWACRQLPGQARRMRPPSAPVRGCRAPAVIPSPTATGPVRPRIAPQRSLR